MPSGLIPLFPLRVVVFPRTRLSLHVFEERYKEMVADAIRDRTEFGVVLAEGDGVMNVGCTVTVEKVLETYPDGRMDILTRGRRRFEIVALNEDRSYLQAEVSYFDDEDPDPASPELRDRALSQYRVLSELAEAEERSEPDLADPQLSFQLAQVLPDLGFLSLLLRERSESGWLKHLNHYLAEFIPRQRTIERMKALAPTNGCGPRPAGT